MKCHLRQYNFWKTTKHALAYNTLERLNKHLDPECTGCHTTERSPDLNYIKRLPLISCPRET